MVALLIIDWSVRGLFGLISPVSSVSKNVWSISGISLTYMGTTLDIPAACERVFWSYLMWGLFWGWKVIVPVDAYAPPKNMTRSKSGREYIVPSTPANRTVGVPKNSFAVSYAFSRLNCVFMNDASRSS